MLRDCVAIVVRRLRGMMLLLLIAALIPVSCTTFRRGAEYHQRHMSQQDSVHHASAISAQAQSAAFDSTARTSQDTESRHADWTYSLDSTAIRHHGDSLKVIEHWHTTLGGVVEMSRYRWNGQFMTAERALAVSGSQAAEAISSAAATGSSTVVSSRSQTSFGSWVSSLTDCFGVLLMLVMVAAVTAVVIRYRKYLPFTSASR
jgi:hypothetical protein